MIVRRGHDGRRQSVLMRWGLIPSWVRDFDKLGTLSTARAETVCEKPSFRGAMRHKRCLIPADGFFMGADLVAATAVAAGQASHSLLGIAGLYEDWMGADGSEIDSVAMITRSTAGTTLSAHGARMPVIIPPAQYDAWLDCRGVRDREAAELLECAPPADLQVSEIKKD